MPDGKGSRLQEVYFLPPLQMVLTFYDRTLHGPVEQKKMTDEQEELNEKTVEKLIEKLSEKTN
jgi:hypothetical protein